MFSKRLTGKCQTKEESLRGLPMAKKTRACDVEKGYSAKATAAKLRRLADALEAGKAFRIQVAGEPVYIPAGTLFNIEHERDGKHEEIEFQFKWTNP